MDKYKCKVCGYIYDEEAGESRSNTEPGTPFTELPSKWRCPQCGAAIIRFQKL